MKCKTQLKCFINKQVEVLLNQNMKVNANMIIQIKNVKYLKIAKLYGKIKLNSCL